MFLQTVLAFCALERARKWSKSQEQASTMLDRSSAPRKSQTLLHSRAESAFPSLYSDKVSKTLGPFISVVVKSSLHLEDLVSSLLDIYLVVLASPATAVASQAEML